MEDVRWIKDGDLLERVQHGYDRTGNKRWRQNLVAESGQDEFYNYDKLQQLAQLERGDLNANRTAIAGIPAKEEDFTYDPTGNWGQYQIRETGNLLLDQSRVHNKVNETVQVAGSNATVAYDPAGNMVRMPSLTSPLPLTPCHLTWDAWNRLVRIAEGETVIAEYYYDGLFRRTKKAVGSQTRHFYYSDKWQIVEERVGTITSAERQFVWGLQHVDDLVLRERFTPSTQRLYAVQDTMHVTAVTNDAGNVVERYGYDAFGGTRVMGQDFGAKSSSDYDWETLFCGYRWDSDSALYQVRYRYLHNGLGRWLNRDPVAGLPLLDFGIEALNLYSYASNLPVLLADDLGLKSLLKKCGFHPA